MVPLVQRVSGDKFLLLATTVPSHSYNLRECAAVRLAPIYEAQVAAWTRPGTRCLRPADASCANPHSTAHLSTPASRRGALIKRWKEDVAQCQKGADFCQRLAGCKL
jgi:hypothetical protein